ncbi:MAG TPA: 6-hydroxymethylpterin diphosphokinase MptE-like protein [Rhabdochlamydiaceae bacterium]|nr:6-hydroxymethylpterin diphosphokinase MptE-like protein [Rhabdochlamydiaceae bacterium]
MLEIESFSALNERFPDIGFHLSFSQYEPFELFEDKERKINAKRSVQFLHSPTSIPEELKQWQSRLDLHEKEIIYIYGIGLGYYYEVLKSWLAEKRERMIIFLEDDIAVFEALVKIDSNLISDPQVHIRYIPNHHDLDQLLEELVQNYPCDRIEVSALESYRHRFPKKCRDIQIMLFRKTTLFSALMSDVLYSHKLFANLLKNFKRLPEAFFANRLKNAFTGIPAIICGAGPSLQESIPFLREMENKALIIAGGSSFTALTAQMVLPHLGMALDPNPDEYLRLKPNCGFEVPIIYGNRVLPDIFGTLNGPHGYLRSETGGSCELWMEDKLGIDADSIGPDLDREALSVTTLGLSLAYAMGCDPIILTGVDLAYTNMQRYASGVMTSVGVSSDQLKQVSKASDKLIRKKGSNGKMVYTLIKWLMESDSISIYAKERPERTFINATSGGIGFSGLPYISLETAIKERCQLTHDIRGRVHTLIQQFRFSGIETNSHVQELKKSLERCLCICDEMLMEIQNNKENPSQTGKMVILEIDFQEEMAFDCLLSALGPALDRIMNRCHSNSQQNDLDRFQTKWSHIKSLINSTLNSYSSA